MNDVIKSVVAELGAVTTRDDFERWVRQELRRLMPHAMFIATLGKALRMGSAPTHRIGVDCPFNLIENLKIDTGALDDPLMFRWFQNGRASIINVADINNHAEHEYWRKTMLRYGVRNMTISGYMDHAAKRFVTFQLANPHGGGSIENLRMLTDLSEVMAEAAWRSVLSGSTKCKRGSMFDPTLGLTPTEVQIVELIAQGFSNKEIARRRGVSDSTVKTQVQRTGAKLGATRRAEIVAVAMPMLRVLPAQALIDYDDF